LVFEIYAGVGWTTVVTQAVNRGPRTSTWSVLIDMDVLLLRGRADCEQAETGCSERAR
jgi:hypothetical protein